MKKILFFVGVLSLLSFAATVVKNVTDMQGVYRMLSQLYTDGTQNQNSTAKQLKIVYFFVRI